jgi:hypothetical protein
MGPSTAVARDTHFSIFPAFVCGLVSGLPDSAIDTLQNKRLTAERQTSKAKVGKTRTLSLLISHELFSCDKKKNLAFCYHTMVAYYQIRLAAVYGRRSVNTTKATLVFGRAVFSRKLMSVQLI